MTNIIEAESTIKEVRTAESIAIEINTIKRQTQKVMLSASIEIGKRLAEAKEMVEHGHWGEWLQDNVSYSERTAQNLIKVYEQFGNSFGTNEMESLFTSNQPNVFEELSYTQALALLALPTMEERKEFVEEHNLEEMSTRELQEEIKARKKAEEKAEQADIRIKKLRKQLKEAKEKAAQSEEDEKEHERLKEKLQQANQKIEQLQEAPDPEKEQKIENLEKLVEQLQREKNEDEDKKRFQIHLKMIQTGFNEMVKDIMAITDDEKRESYKGAAKKLLQKLEELI